VRLTALLVIRSSVLFADGIIVSILLLRENPQTVGVCHGANWVLAVVENLAVLMAA
jgi:hypothetical protein